MCATSTLEGNKIAPVSLAARRTLSFRQGNGFAPVLPAKIGATPDIAICMLVYKTRLGAYARQKVEKERSGSSYDLIRPCPESHSYGKSGMGLYPVNNLSTPQKVAEERRTCTPSSPHDGSIRFQDGPGSLVRFFFHGGPTWNCTKMSLLKRQDSG